MNGETALELYEDRLRKHFLKYTRKAFRMLPSLDKPRILDIGCGSGIPTLELAKLSNGQITGLDINQPHLNRFKRKIRKVGLSDRVKTLKCSMFDMDFPDESFDIIWAEGSIWIIGFERGIKEWRRFLKSDSFLVVHDAIKTVSSKLKEISSYGYKLVNHFSLPEDAWWTEYYMPLETRIEELHMRFKNRPKALEMLEKHQDEIDMVKRNPEEHSPAFYILRKS